MKILVINCGSSSLKFQLINMDDLLFARELLKESAYRLKAAKRISSIRQTVKALFMIRKFRLTLMHLILLWSS